MRRPASQVGQGEIDCCLLTAIDGRGRAIWRPTNEELVHLDLRSIRLGGGGAQGHGHGSQIHLHREPAVGGVTTTAGVGTLVALAAIGIRTSAITTA